MGYKEFVEDVALIRKVRKNCGKPTILANYWMKRICNKSKTEIRKYVDNDKKECQIHINMNQKKEIGKIHKKGYTKRKSCVIIYK